MYNTDVYKRNFFALYVGQEVYTCVGYKHTYDPSSYFDSDWPFDENDDVKWALTNPHLILKSISDTSDSDIIKVAEIFHLDHSNPPSIVNDVHRLLKCINSPDSSINPMYLKEWLYTIDYLRSQAYAVPYMGISIETLIEWGWVKIKGGQDA